MHLMLVALIDIPVASVGLLNKKSFIFLLINN